MNLCNRDAGLENFIFMNNFQITFADLYPSRTQGMQL